jgi:hypothetical protein
MQRKTERLNESFDRETLTFESTTEAAAYKRLMPEGEYPLPGVPGYVLRVSYLATGACGQRIIEVVKHEAMPEKPKEPAASVNPELEAKLEAMTPPQLEQYAVERGIKFPAGANKKQKIGAVLKGAK